MNISDKTDKFVLLVNSLTSQISNVAKLYIETSNYFSDNLSIYVVYDKKDRKNENNVFLSFYNEETNKRETISGVLSFNAKQSGIKPIDYGNEIKILTLESAISMAVSNFIKQFEQKLIQHKINEVRCVIDSRQNKNFKPIWDYFSNEIKVDFAVLIEKEEGFKLDTQFGFMNKINDNTLSSANGDNLFISEDDFSLARIDEFRKHYVFRLDSCPNELQYCDSGNFLWRYCESMPSDCLEYKQWSDLIRKFDLNTIKNTIYLKPFSFDEWV